MFITCVKAHKRRERGWCERGRQLIVAGKPCLYIGCHTPTPYVWEVHTSVHIAMLEEETSFCSREGKFQLAPLPLLPRGWLEMYQGVVFKTVSRRYNALFSFTAIGVSGEEGLVQEGAASCAKIHGRMYHRVLPADMRGTV